LLIIFCDLKTIIISNSEIIAG